MQFAAALSREPIAFVAAREVIGALRDALPGKPDFAALFVTAPHRDLLSVIARMIRQELSPGTLIGCTAESVVGADTEVEEEPAVSLLVASLPGVSLSAFHLDIEAWSRLLDDPAALSTATGLNAETRGVLLLGDPYTTPVEQLLRTVDLAAPRAATFGGLASVGRPQGDLLLLNDQVVDEGTVGVAFAGALNIRTVVSQGCRPIGERMLVTRAEGNLVQSLGGEVALERTRTTLDVLSEEDQLLAANGIYLGVAMNEYQLDFGRGDFLMRNVLGADPESGAVAVGQVVRAGQTVQFHVRDAGTADEDLRLLLTAEQAAGAEPRGALLFTCNGRGCRMFDLPHHDARALSTAFAGLPASGFFAAGEIGRVGLRTFLHGHTASIALFEPE